MKTRTLVTVFAIVVASAVLPSAATAGEPVIDPSGVTFSGTSASTMVLEASGEPGITCETFHITASLIPPNLSVQWTNCHIVVLGFTIACRTPGSALSNSMNMAGTFVTTYLTDAKTKPGIRFSPGTTTVECGSTTPIIFTGSVLGTITSPACGGESSTATLSFTRTSGVQDHKKITGTGSEFNLTAETKGSGTKRQAALSAQGTVTFSHVIKLTCV